MNKELKKIVDESNNIVFFGGAGVSTESNIPDFRSKEGLYNAVQKYGAPPETILSHSFFIKNTKTFYEYYKENLVHLEAKPNKAHKALAKLEEEGKLKAIVTQNIDGLHQMAGSKKVFELHGSIFRNYCMSCHEFYDVNYIFDDSKLKDGVPICEKCGGIVKPDVVLYEEALDQEQVVGGVNAIIQADLLIVGGTSLAVYPAAGFLNEFHGKNLVLINKQSTDKDYMANLIIRDSIGKVLDY